MRAELAELSALYPMAICFDVATSINSETHRHRRYQQRQRRYQSLCLTAYRKEPIHCFFSLFAELQNIGDVARLPHVNTRQAATKTHGQTYLVGTKKQMNSLVTLKNPL